MEQKTTARKKTMVYQAVFTDIIKGVYDYSSIITERNLVTKYQVSKAPVREALLELCNEDILQSIPRLGYHLKPLNYRELIDALTVRSVIELAALDLTFLHITEAQVNALETMEYKNRTSISTSDPYQRWTTNREFHITLCALSHNKYLVNTLDSLLKVCLRGAPEFFGGPWDRDLKVVEKGRHILLLEAIKNHDLEKAKQLLKEDITDYKSAFMME